MECTLVPLAGHAAPCICPAGVASPPVVSTLQKRSPRGGSRVARPTDQRTFRAKRFSISDIPSGMGTRETAVVLLRDSLSCYNSSKRVLVGGILQPAGQMVIQYRSDVKHILPRPGCSMLLLVCRRRPSSTWQSCRLVFRRGRAIAANLWRVDCLEEQVSARASRPTVGAASNCSEAQTRGEAGGNIRPTFSIGVLLFRSYARILEIKKIAMQIQLGSPAYTFEILVRSHEKITRISAIQA